MLLVAPRYFYATIPGVAASGPLNVHLLQDVAVAYSVLALGLGCAPANFARARFATAAAALYLGGHAALHLYIELSTANVQLTCAEAPGVYLPAILATGIALRFEHMKRPPARAEPAARSVP